MRWKGRRQSGNIRDLRGSSSGRSGTKGGARSRLPGSLRQSRGQSRGGNRIRLPRPRAGTGGRRAGGGLGIGGLIIIGLIMLAFGMNPLSLLGLGSQTGSGNFTAPTTQNAPVTANAEQAEFVAVVLAETEDVWNGIFQASGANYVEPELVLFSGSVESACGFASSASGPFYCPGDSRIYLDMSFFDELANRFGASGDFAQAYVIAHEVGHHIQNLTGQLLDFNTRRSSMSQIEQNRFTVRLELQADCYAGVWGYFTAQRGLLERGDLQEALNAATQIGDDTIQRRTQGYVVPESFNHGTSEQRRSWFDQGFSTGRVEQCDTFSQAYENL
ncbi:MAG: neutral zinc metallopeptidase [Pseudomonadota bacterium]